MLSKQLKDVSSLKWTTQLWRCEASRTVKDGFQFKRVLVHKLENLETVVFNEDKKIKIV
jgi:hypothetical protein